MWEAPADARWEPLPQAEGLRSFLKDEELVKQYGLKFAANGRDCRYWPAEGAGTWICTCGGLNLEEEAACHRCGLCLADLLAVDMGELKAARDARLEEEARLAAEKAEAERLAAEKKAEAERLAREEADRKAAERAAKTKKLLKILLPALAACIALVVILIKVLAPVSDYRKAVKMMEDGKYDEAIAAFEIMGDYKDSRHMIVQTLHNKACEQAKRGDYAGAKATIALMENAGDTEEDRALIDDAKVVCDDAVAVLVEKALESKEHPVDESKLVELYAEETEVVTAYCRNHPQECFTIAQILLKNGKNTDAAALFKLCIDEQDSKQYLAYLEGRSAYDNKAFQQARDIFAGLSGFSDADMWYRKSIYGYLSSGTFELEKVVEMLKDLPELDDAWPTRYEMCRDLIKLEGTYTSKEQSSMGKTSGYTGHTAVLDFCMEDGFIRAKNAIFTPAGKSLDVVKNKKPHEITGNWVSDYENYLYKIPSEDKYGKELLYYFEDGKLIEINKTAWNMYYFVKN